MRKAFVALGIILLFAGLIVASVSARVSENKQSFLVHESKDSWETSGHFEKDDKLIFTFSPTPLEGESFPDGGGNATIYVEIVDPYGNKTVFKVVFSRVGGYPAPPKFSVVSNEGGLIVSEPLGEIGGIVCFKGYYLANITTRNWERPRTLQLHAEIVEKEYPYLSILPVGITLIVVGGSLSIWGAKSSKRRLRSRMKKS